MKRIISILMLVTLLVSMCATAFAYDSNNLIMNANGWKGGSYFKRVAEGSFWKARYKSGATDSSTVYLYRKGHDRCTPKYTLSKGAERTGLNYLSGQAVTGDYYKIVGSGTAGKSYSYYFNP
jgi:hypothetical protein